MRYMTSLLHVDPSTPVRRRLPPWMKKPAGNAETIVDLKKNFRGRKIFTVCEEARCPNLGECWTRKIATFMIGGEVCTRACRFCAVKSGKPPPLDPAEPEQTAQAVEDLELKHVVITSVARDDVPDEGAGHFAETIARIRARMPKTTIEVLVPDFHGRHECLDIVGHARPDIFNHNIETVRRLTPSIRSKARYDRTLQVLRDFRTRFPRIMTKSGIMVGFGESTAEVHATLDDLRAVGCAVVTIGQYLQPTQQHHPVVDFVTPEQFAAYERYGQEIGFTYTFAGPFVRSSYMAEHQFIRATVKESL
jgi:lipoyl synthase